MAARILQVVFEVEVNRNEARFRVPLRALDLLRIPHNGHVALAIRDKTGRLLFRGAHKMESKAEVYGDDMKGRIRPRQTIVVKASRP